MTKFSKLGPALSGLFAATRRPLALLRVDAQEAFRVASANPAFLRATGCEESDVIDQDLTDLLAFDDIEAQRSSLVDIATGAADHALLRARIVRSDGTCRWVDAELSAADEATDGARWLLAGLRDVSHEVADAEARRVRDAITEVLAAAASVEGSISALLPAFARALDFEFAAAWTVDGDAEQLRCCSLWESGPSTSAYARVTRELPLRRGVGLPGRTWASGRPEALMDDPAEVCPRSGAAEHDGIRSAVAFPILVGSDLRGVFELATIGSRDVDEPLLALLGDLSAEIGGLLGRKRSQERRPGTTQLLLVEDNAFIARLVAEMLQAQERSLELVHVESLAAAREWLSGSRPACVLLDLTLPDAHGLQSLLEVRSAAPDVPVVVLTGTEDERLAVRAVQEGAQDYLVKRKVDLDGLARAVRYAIERKGAEQQLLEHGLRDHLTGLPNRVLFLDRLRVALGRSGRGIISVLLVNLDRFRLLNDSLGHEWGDRLLAAAAERLSRTVRAGVTVASLGGDEFAVLADVTDADDAVRLGERLRATISHPYDFDGQKLHIAATVGIAMNAEGGVSAETLMAQADTALARGKELEGARCEMFDESVREQLRERLSLEIGLRTAIDRRQLRLHYQPIVELKGRQVVAVEALVRWQHPERGLIPPGDFLPLAEDSGLIVPIGRWAIEEALRDLATWDVADRGGVTVTRVNVNLSARELAEPDLVEAVAAALDRAGASAESLCLEVTETGLIVDLERSVRTLSALRELGVALALDDFGTGYSSLGYLERFPVGLLKLDRSFVHALSGHGKEAIVAAVANMARALGLPALAEGIETEAELDQLLGFGYTLGQGYLFGRPMPAAELQRLLTGAATEAV